jgi:hypothetical protein
MKPMNIFDDADVISTYTLEQAIEDGVLAAIFQNCRAFNQGKDTSVSSSMAGALRRQADCRNSAPVQ